MLKRMLLLLTTVLVLGACGKDAVEEKVEVKKPVKTIELKVENLGKRIEGATSLEAKLESRQTTPGGDIVEVYFKNGDRVVEGDLIVKLEDDGVESRYKQSLANYLSAKANYERTEKFAQLDVENGLKQAKAAYTNALETLNKARRGGNAEQKEIARATYEAAKTAFEEAKLNLEKNTNLYEEELISQDQFLRVQTAYNQANANLSSAKNNLTLTERGADQEDINTLEANLKNAESILKIAQKNVDEKTWEYTIQMAKSQYMAAEAQYTLAKIDFEDLDVKAELSGVITNLNNKKLDTVKNEDVLFTIVDDSFMEFRLGVNVQDVPYVEVGSKVDLDLGGLNKTFEGQIVEINPSSSGADRKFMVKGKVENKDGILKKGMYANAVISGVEQEVIAVPKNAVVIKGLYKYIYINDNGIAKRITVETGSDYGDRVEVIIEKNSIKEGDKLVVEGQYLLENEDLIEEVK